MFFMCPSKVMSLSLHGAAVHVSHSLYSDLFTNIGHLVILVVITIYM